MSVILDALKKLDREKSSRRSGTSNIAIEILRPDLPRPGKRIPRYVAIAFLASIATAAITYSVMLKGGFLSKSPPPAAVNPSALNQQVAPVPIPSEPARDTRDEISPVPLKIQSPVKSKKHAASLVENKGDEKKINRNVSLKEADTAPEKTNIPSEHAANGSAATLPSLNISAIVWYEEPSKRFAMINGLIATEGSVVEGMKVEEIYPNRVRFLHNGQHLEISIK
jgi:general secretion pathway protein B